MLSHSLIPSLIEGVKERGVEVMINLARMQKNYIMRSFVEYYKGDKIKDELHETCNTHGRHEQWAAYMQNCIVSMEE